jgi:hypothetical protein
MAATNKCLAQSNKSSRRGQATKKRNRKSTGIAMKRCAQCHGKLGLGVRARKVWNGRWWVQRRIVRPFMSWSDPALAPTLAGTPSYFASVRRAEPNATSAEVPLWLSNLSTCRPACIFLDNGLHFFGQTQAGERLGDQRKATREVIAGTAIKPHLPAALAGRCGSHRA